MQFDLHLKLKQPAAFSVLRTSFTRKTPLRGLDGRTEQQRPPTACFYDRGLASRFSEDCKLHGLID